MVLKILSTPNSSSSYNEKDIIISEPRNFQRKTFSESINLKEYINKEWFILFKESGVKRSQLRDPIELLYIFTTIYNYLGLNNGDITIFKNKPPLSSLDIRNENEDEKEICSICLDNINDKDSIWCCNNCSNNLHTNCVSTWASYTPKVYQWTCPNCRNGNDHLPNPK
ncbi:hypothetical protein RB653_002928 [Dictyostelium firmibasis]|uniref:PHD-type domain-containing protein n=1 Tax=Dictyostelium firmibasis TaxID=79012 RepID=A0AAN7U3Q1_9MYCE